MKWRHRKRADQRARDRALANSVEVLFVEVEKRRDPWRGSIMYYTTDFAGESPTEEEIAGSRFDWSDN
jgi:hypothetical protein